VLAIAIVRLSNKKLKSLLVFLHYRDWYSAVISSYPWPFQWPYGPDKHPRSVHLKSFQLVYSGRPATD